MEKPSLTPEQQEVLTDFGKFLAQGKDRLVSLFLALIGICFACGAFLLLDDPMYFAGGLFPLGIGLGAFLAFLWIHHRDKQYQKKLFEKFNIKD